MARFFDSSQYAIVQAACARLIPTDRDPGATEAGVVDYIDGFLGAFASDPPLIWAGGPFSGRLGGNPRFAVFHRLSQRDELAWRTRIEGSMGIPERERLGPVVGLQERYRAGVEALGADFVLVSPEEQDRRLKDDPSSWSSYVSTRARGCTAHPSTWAIAIWSAGATSVSKGTSNPGATPTRR